MNSNQVTKHTMQPNPALTRKLTMTQRKFPDDFVPAPPRSDPGSVTDSEIIAMAWCDDTSFDSIEMQTGMTEHEVIRLMQRSIKPSNFRKWRKRAGGRAAKHDARIDGDGF